MFIRDILIPILLFFLCSLIFWFWYFLYLEPAIDKFVKWLHNRNKE